MTSRIDSVRDAPRKPKRSSRCADTGDSVASTIVRAWASASSRVTSPSPSRLRCYEEQGLIHSERNAAIGIEEAGTRRPLSRHRAYTAIRVGYANTHRSAWEVQAIGSTHRKTPRRRTWHGQDAKGRDRSWPCCWRAVAAPPTGAEPFADEAVFSAATRAALGAKKEGAGFEACARMIGQRRLESQVQTEADLARPPARTRAIPIVGGSDLSEVRAGHV